MTALLLSLAFARVVPKEHAALEAEIDGALVELPLLSSTVRADLDGDIASVTLVQTFANPGEAPMNARYVFPLPEDAAVHRMRMTAGDTVVEAEIQRKAEAQATYEAAKSEGKQASLLEQHRPNVFTQQIANLPPGEEVSVTIEYAHAVPREDGAYRFVFPMTVGPRYTGMPRVEGDPEPLGSGGWTLSSGEAVLPASIAHSAIDLEVRVDGGMPIEVATSPSHDIATRGHGELMEIRLVEATPVANADFVLEYSLAGESARAGTTAWAENGKGVVSLLIEPPAAASEAQITPRELVFLLDTSCSMNGVAIESSKAFMREALGHMRSSDTFRIHRFGSDVDELSAAALPATSQNVERGVEYVDSLSANGGTNMNLGLHAALDPADDPDRMRIVVFLTDGYIGQDFEILQLVESIRGDARLFSLGIGTSVNRYLLEELARSGKGTARIVLDPEDAPAEALALAERLETPFLTDVHIDWGDAPIHDATPRDAPDLFLGDSLRVMALYDSPGTYPVTVRGTLNGRPAALPLQVELPADSEGSDALPVVWARAQVSDRMIDWMSPRTEAADKAAVVEEITTLGLEYRLVTQWTSFVAVAKDRPIAENAIDVDVPTPAPKATSMTNGVHFGGSSAPEPAEWAVLGCLALLGLVVFRQRSAVG